MLGTQTGLSKPNMLGLHRAHQYNDFFFILGLKLDANV